MNKRKRKKFILTILSIITGLVIVFPLLYALSLSFMSPAEMTQYPHKIIPSIPTLDNFKTALNTVPLLKFIANSFVVSLAVTVGQVITASLASYAFAFYDFKGKNLLFLMVLSTMMIPAETTVISNFLTVSSWGWNDSLKVLFRILIPISKPAIASLSIYVFINTWNQYLWPLLTINNGNNRTVQIGISMLQYSEGSSYGVVLAGAILILIPSVIVFMLGQKQLVKGMTAGAVKG